MFAKTFLVRKISTSAVDWVLLFFVGVHRKIFLFLRCVIEAFT